MGESLTSWTVDNPGNIKERVKIEHLQDLEIWKGETQHTFHNFKKLKELNKYMIFS